jgi:hypothetical protein
MLKMEMRNEEPIANQTRKGKYERPGPYKDNSLRVYYGSNAYGSAFVGLTDGTYALNMCYSSVCFNSKSVSHRQFTFQDATVSIQKSISFFRIREHPPLLELEGLLPRLQYPSTDLSVESHESTHTSRKFRCIRHRPLSEMSLLNAITGSEYFARWTGACCTLTPAAKGAGSSATRENVRCRSLWFISISITGSLINNRKSCSSGRHSYTDIRCDRCTWPQCGCREPRIYYTSRQYSGTDFTETVSLILCKSIHGSRLISACPSFICIDVR